MASDTHVPGAARVALPRWLRVLLLALVGLLLLFSLLGFFVAPFFLQRIGQRELSASLGRRVEIASVRVNPFALSLTVRGVQLYEADGSTPGAGFTRLYLDAAWSSLYRRAPVLRAVRLERPWIRIVKLKATRHHPDRYNLSDIVDRLTARPAAPAGARASAPAPSGPPRFSVRGIEVTGGEVTFEDRKVARTHRLSSLLFRLPLLSTFPESLGADVRPTLDFYLDGAPVSLAGRARPFQATPEGSLRVDVDQFDLARLLPHLPDPLPIRVTSAKLDAGLDLSFERPPEGAPGLTVRGRVALVEVALQRREGGPALPLERLRLPRIDLGGLAFDLGRRRLSIGQVIGRGGEVWLERAAQVAGDEASRPPRPTGEAPRARGSARGRPRPWAFSVGRLEVPGWKIHLLDRQVRPAASLTVAPVDLAATNLGTEPGPARKEEGKEERKGDSTEGKIDLSLGLPPRGRVTVAGAVGLRPLRARLEVGLRDVDLRPVQPYLAERFNVVLRGGTVSSRGTLDFEQPEASRTQPSPEPRVQYRGDIAVDRLDSVDARDRRPLLGWRSLRLQGLALATLPPALAVAEISLTDLLCRLAVLPDARLNVETLARRTQPEPEPQVEPAPARRDRPAPVRVAVDRVTVRRGRVLFSDRHIRPSFRTEISRLDGRLTRLSSRSGSAAQLSLRATIDESGRVNVGGRMQPFGSNPSLDLSVDVRNVELVPVSPYAARYAGHPIRKGKLALALRYRVRDRQLDARNHLRVDQLVLGDKVASPEATKLPVRLAVALLRDRHGVIDVDLPVAGSLDDPNFKLFRAILTALGRLVAKAATAPFSLAASALGNDQDELSRVSFPPGRAGLDAEAQRNIGALAQVLRERPGLSFEIEGQADPRRDLFDPPADADVLRTLAQQRAGAVRDALTRIEPQAAGRLFLVSPRVAAGPSAGGVELRLKEK